MPRNFVAYGGNVDAITSEIVDGWVWDGNTERKLVVEIVADGEVVATAVANCFRQDLLSAGVGDGAHAFVAKLPSRVNWSRAKIFARVQKGDFVLPPNTAAEPKLTELKHTELKHTEPKLTDYEIVAAEFDADFYISRYRQDIPADTPPLDHYLTIGWREGRSPAPWFSTLAYMSKYTDVAMASVNPVGMASVNPFLHYLKHGREEEREIVAAPPPQSERHFRYLKRLVEEAIDPNHYTLPSGSSELSDLALNYMFVGRKLFKDPCPWFSVQDYLSAYPDVREADADPFAHYLSVGRTEGRQPNRNVRDAIESEFDVKYYLEQKPRLGPFEPIEHFLAFGWSRFFDPSPNFSVRTYLQLNPDVKKAGVNPFFHFLTSGQFEGRAGKVTSRRKISATAVLPSLLFVGHDALHAGAQVVLLQIVRWFANHTRYPIKVVLLGPGRLASQYAEYADVFVSLEDADYAADGELRAFLNEKFALCYVNTVAAAKIWPLVEKMENTSVAIHVHEMEGEISNNIKYLKGLAPHLSTVIVVSQAARAAFEKADLISGDKIFLSHAFIDIAAGDWSNVIERRQEVRSALNLGSEAFVVMGCGTAYSRKGIDLFVETALKCVVLSDRFRFVWIGDGADLDRERSRVSAAKREREINFVGFRSDANMLLAAADVFFLPSREDPFPLVCLEAAQFGVPSVYFEGATGISEFCRNDAGVGVPAFDTEAAAEAISLYFAKAGRRERAGAVARTRVMDDHNTQKRIVEIWTHLAASCKLAPAVSVVVPAYNHQRFISDRLDSILNQTVKNIEIIVLDDHSSDRTVNVVRRFDDPRIRLIVNDRNSGSAFRQWKKGATQAQSDFIWIAEGDDVAEHSLLERLLPAFDDPEVNLAFCRTEIINALGERQPGVLDSYYANSSFPLQSESAKLEGLTAVNAGFGALCLIVNASAAISRRTALFKHLDIATEFQMCGDWALYLLLIKDAKLFYTSSVSNFFRRHTASVVHKIEGTPTYFQERVRIAELVIASFPLKRATVRAMLAEIYKEQDRFANRGAVTREWLGDSLAKVAAHARREPKSWNIGVYVHGMLFSKGGIERIAAQIASGLSRRGHQVTIFCRTWGTATPIYRLAENISIVGIFNEGDIERSKTELRAAIASSDFDVFIPMLSEWLFEPIVEVCVELGVPVIASEHNDPWQIEERWWSKERRRDCFAKAGAIHLLLERFRPSLPLDCQDRIFVIPNGVGGADEALAPPQKRLPRIISVGRLEPQKRHDRLIRAFGKLKDKCPGWEVHIFGEGGEKERLAALIAELGLRGRVILRGRSENIESELNVASIFVIASEFEGFGIVVLEAQRAGLPCIGYENCNGPNELIAHERDGVLISPDETGDSLAKALVTLVDDSKRRTSLGAAGHESVRRFNLDGIVDRWEAMITTVIERAAKLDGN